MKGSADEHDYNKRMNDSPSDYDPRYLAGIVLFNRADYFEAHEVWEDLWMESAGTERRFVQGLIQAAVGLLHFGNGNLRGAKKLYVSSRDYMRDLTGRFLGLDVIAFWLQMDKCFAPLIATEQTPASASLDEEALPTIQLDPPPAQWPDAAQYVEVDD